MAKIVMTAPTTSAASAQPFDATGYTSVGISADNLATTEVVNIYVDGKAVTLTDGTVMKLTASIPALTLQGGVYYTYSKDATAGACGVYMWTPGKLNV